MSGWAIAAKIAADLYQENRQRKYQKSQQRSLIQRRVQDAQMAGISPLAAIGAGGYSSSSSPSGSGGPLTGISKLIQNLEVQQRRENLDKTKAETDEVRLRNEQLRGQILQERLGKLREPDSDAAPTGQIEQIEPYKIPSHSQESAKAGRGGLHLKSELGNLLYDPKQPSKQQLEDQTGEIYSELAALLGTAKAAARYKAAQLKVISLIPMPKSKPKHFSKEQWQEYKRKVYHNRKVLLNTSIKRWIERRRK